MNDDLVQRQFAATAANRLWLTDITEHPAGEGTLYLCAVKDAYSRRIVGYSIDRRMKARLAEVAGCTAHSDRGSQFGARKYLRALARHGLAGSMGRVGAAADNAAMESFFALPQNNVLDRQSWRTRHDLRLAIVSWLEHTYHRRRPQKRLGRLTPPSNTKPSSPTAPLAA